MVKKKYYGKYIYMIPFLMTLLGMLLYNRFPLDDSFWYSGSQIITFFFVSYGSIVLTLEVIRRKKINEGK